MVNARNYVAHHKAGTILLLIGIVIGFSGFIYLNFYRANNIFTKIVQDFYSNFSSELVSIALTVLIIDYLNKKREDAQLKDQLIRDLGARDNVFALRAVRELSHHRWLYDGSLRRVVFACAYLQDADLSRADLKEVNLREANLNRSRLVRSDLENVKLMKAELNSANLERAFIRRGRLEGAQLVSATLESANLRVAFLNGANLEQANVSGADLRKANLEDANFKKAILKGANLLGANITNTDFTDAIYDQYTVWPEGFNAKRRGAILKESRSSRRKVAKSSGVSTNRVANSTA